MYLFTTILIDGTSSICLKWLSSFKWLDGKDHNGAGVKAGNQQLANNEMRYGTNVNGGVVDQSSLTLIVLPTYAKYGCWLSLSKRCIAVWHLGLNITMARLSLLQVSNPFGVLRCLILGPPITKHGYDWCYMEMMLPKLGRMRFESTSRLRYGWILEICK